MWKKPFDLNVLTAKNPGIIKESVFLYRAVKCVGVSGCDLKSERCGSDISRRAYGADEK